MTWAPGSVAKLEERMNTHQADYKASLERMERKMAERDGKRGAEAAKRKVKDARHHTFVLVGISVIVALEIAIMGLVITSTLD